MSKIEAQAMRSSQATNITDHDSVLGGLGGPQ